MIRRIFSVACAAIVAGVLGYSQAEANIIYDLSYTSPSGTASGFIETDGNIGTLVPGDFYDWDITLTIGALTATLEGPHSGNNSSLNCCSSTAPVTASATELTFDFGSVLTGGLFGFGLSAGGTRLCYADKSTENCAGPHPGIGWQIGAGTPGTGIGPPADDVIATVTETPLPAALSLFATGLGALGLLGWRKKRKAAALAV